MKIGNPFQVLDSVSSTNLHAQQEIANGNIKEGTAWHADYQFQGKGQRGKTWIANRGDNINLSVVLCPNMLKPNESFLLNVVIALSIFDFYSDIAGGDTRIKWSNDIYWKDKKAGGILIENTFQGHRWKYAVVGIGINLNQKKFDSSLPNPVSLRQITGRYFEPVAMAKKLCGYIDTRYQKLKNRQPDALIQEYKSHLFHLHQPALYQMNDEVFEATIRDVNNDGKLILEKYEVFLEVNFGEIKFLL